MEDVIESTAAASEDVTAAAGTQQTGETHSKVAREGGAIEKYTNGIGEYSSLLGADEAISVPYGFRWLWEYDGHACKVKQVVANPNQHGRFVSLGKYSNVNTQTFHLCSLPIIYSLSIHTHPYIYDLLIVFLRR